MRETPEEFALNVLGVPFGMEAFQSRLLQIQNDIAIHVAARDAQVRRDALEEAANLVRTYPCADGWNGCECPNIASAIRALASVNP